MRHSVISILHSSLWLFISPSLWIYIYHLDVSMWESALTEMHIFIKHWLFWFRTSIFHFSITLMWTLENRNGYDRLRPKNISMIIFVVIIAIIKNIAIIVFISIVSCLWIRFFRSKWCCKICHNLRLKLLERKKKLIENLFISTICFFIFNESYCY